MSFLPKLNILPSIPLTTVSVYIFRLWLIDWLIDCLFYCSIFNDSLTHYQTTNINLHALIFRFTIEIRIIGNLRLSLLTIASVITAAFHYQLHYVMRQILSLMTRRVTSNYLVSFCNLLSSRYLKFSPHLKVTFKACRNYSPRSVSAIYAGTLFFLSLKIISILENRKSFGAYSED